MKKKCSQNEERKLKKIQIQKYEKRNKLEKKR